MPRCGVARGQEPPAVNLSHLLIPGAQIYNKELVVNIQCCDSPLMLKTKLRLTKNTHIISAIPLCFLYHCCQCVREILEQSVLLMDLHAQNTVQELPDVVVVCRYVYVRSGVMVCTLIDTFVFSIKKRSLPLSSVNMPDMSSTFMRPTPIKPFWISGEGKRHHYSQPQTGNAD